MDGGSDGEESQGKGGGGMRGWIVLYGFGLGDILPKHYKTQKMADKFAAAHRAVGQGCEAVVVNVEDLVAWVNSGVDELERIFKL